MNTLLLCPKCSSKMKSTYTHAGILVDVCVEGCKGVWLDAGELSFFIKNETLKSVFLSHGFKINATSQYTCRRCNVFLNAGQIPGFKHELEECPSCRGIFLDAHEFDKISESDSFSKFKIAKPIIKTLKSSGWRPLSLGMASGVVMLSLYGLLLGVVVLLIESGLIEASLGIPFIVGFVVLQFLIGPWVMDFSLRLFGSLEWKELSQLPPHLRDALSRLCKENKLPLPKVGIIRDGSPQAYTYGRSPGSARLVFSKGILEILDESEMEAVLAHELGHIKHWDFVVMTLAQLVPILLYHIYRVLSDVMKRNRNNKGGKKGGGELAIIALIAYLAYLISQYLVLFVSRVREYYADRFSSFATKKPNSLLTALAKIGFGLVAYHSTQTETDPKERSYEAKQKAVQAMGIMNISGGKEIALSFQGNSKLPNPGDIEESMKWDLWSPWATYYELFSTHPLTAKRIRAIGDHALELGQDPWVKFDHQKPESYWDDFILDLGIFFLPFLLAGLFIFLHTLFNTDKNFQTLLIPAVMGFCFGGVVKTLLIYPNAHQSSGFFDTTVATLLKIVKVSPVRSYAVKLKGHIIGRGEAGSIFSEDMVLRDQTGIIFLNHEPFGFNIFFALFRMNRFKGTDVTIEGWYRRAPLPMIEVKKISTQSDSSSSYTYYYKLIAWFLLPFLTYYFKKFLIKS